MMTKIPQQTKADRALRRRYDKTSALAEGRPIHAVKMSFPKPRRLIALRIEEETLEAVKRLAVAKGLNYSTLMRVWITERLREERA
jgi:predicted DNA binding CopG/RHH family protein